MSLPSSGAAIYPGDPIIHPPITQFLGVVLLLEYLHMEPMGKIMGQNLGVALPT